MNSSKQDINLMLQKKKAIIVGILTAACVVMFIALGSIVGIQIYQVRQVNRTLNTVLDCTQPTGQCYIQASNRGSALILCSRDPSNHSLQQMNDCIRENTAK